MWREAARYEPRMGEGERLARLDDWHRAPGRWRGWVREYPDRPYGLGSNGGRHRPPVMAEMKPQVYKDPRPAEYFDQFHESARQGKTWTYTLARIIVTLPTILM